MRYLFLSALVLVNCQGPLLGMYFSNKKFSDKLDELEKIFKEDSQTCMDNVDSIDENGISLLGHALHQDRNSSFIEWLIKKGSDVKKPSAGETLIAYPLSSGNHQNLAILLKHGAPLSDGNYSHCTAVSCAMHRLSNKLWCKFNTGTTADEANSIINNYMQCITLLVNNGCEVVGTEDGASALNTAINSGLIQLVKLFLEKGVDPRVPFKGKSAVETANESNPYFGRAIVEKLTGHSASQEIRELVNKRAAELNKIK